LKLVLFQINTNECLSLSCNHLVGYLGHVGTAAGEVTAGFAWLHEGKLDTLSDGEGVRVVEHISLGESGFAGVHVVDGNVSLGQPLSLNIHALLWVVFLNHVFTHQVGDLSQGLLVEGSCGRAGHSHLGGVLEGRSSRGFGLSKEVTVLGGEVTLIVQAVVGGNESTEAFTRSVYGSISEVLKVVHVSFVNHTDNLLGLSYVNLGVLMHLLVSSLDNAEAVVDNELLGHLFGLAMV